ncbi:MAG: ABC transporter substrate-binding protein [Methanobacteriota archaeon]|nr:MAG: ABC transporter substrate-binding protein [Euryarchaeota archaeon]
MGGRNPRTVRMIAILVVLILVVSAVAAYYVFFLQSSACNFSSTNPLIFDQPERPDTLDPHVTFSTPGWGIVQQVYQSLVNYNGSDHTTFLPVLAKSWSVSSDGFNYTFVLRQDVHFSNGDPFNAYVMWFSLYRAIIMNADGAFILQENFWLPGVNYYSDTNDSDNATAWVTNALNTWDFFNPTTAQKALMAADNNSFQAVDDYTLVLHTGYGYLGTFPYAFLLASIAGPIASAVDPKVVQQNGLVIPGDRNAWMATHMVGTGPYVLAGGVLDIESAPSYTLNPTPNYWGVNASKAEPKNNIIQPAKSTIQIDFQNDPAIGVNDMKTGKVVGASFAYIGPSTVHSLQGVACVSVNALNTVYGSTAGGWWIYMNQTVEPFNNWSVRQAVVHAINYQRIIDVAFGGYAERWVGPVPPGYPYYNPDSLEPYKYNLTLAQQYMSQSPWPSGYPTPINYEFVNLGDWADVARLLKDDLSKIGINLNTVSIPNIDKLYELQRFDGNGDCIAQTSANGGPFPIGQEFYTSDYISPDDWTQNNAISYGSANVCMAGYNDPTMDTLVLDAATQSDSNVAKAEYAQMTKMMYDNATVAWLVIPTQFQVVNTHLLGYVENPMGAALPFVVVQNTCYATRS